MLKAIIYTVILYSFLASQPLSAFEKAESGLFTFYYTPADRKTADFLIRNGTAIARDVSGLLGFSFTAGITVYIAPDKKSFLAMQPAGARVPRWAIGVAYPLKNRIYLLKGPRIDIERTFRHELSHILLGQAFGGKHRVPRWLDEGLAIIQAGEWSLDRLSKMTFAVLTDRLLPMESLAERFPVDLRKAEIAYCQSFYFISFLKGEFGEAAFQRFLKEYSKYKDFERAIWETYRIGWYTMESRWLKYLSLRFSWIPILTSSGFLWFIAGLVFIWGYLRKKQKSRQKLQQWALEERALYGDDDPDLRH